MTLNDYQKAAERTSGNLASWDKIRNGCYGLNGEAGECIDILKKVEFQGHTFDPNKLRELLPCADMEQVVSCLCPGELFGGPGPSRRHCPEKDADCRACWQREYAEGE